MKRIERLWNIVYYFVFKRYFGLFVALGVSYKALFFQEIKGSRSMAFMFCLTFFLTVSIYFTACGIFQTTTQNIYIFIAGVISLIFNYYVFRKDKCITYSKEFDAQPLRWKRKWGWISFGVIVTICLLLVLSFWYMDYSLHRSGVLP